MTANREELFVYGTLRGTHPAARPAHLPGFSPDVTGPYPTIVPGGVGVDGELIAVDQADLDRFDAYEGYDPDDPEGSLYVRRRTRDGVFVYIGNVSVAPFWDAEFTIEAAARRLAETTIQRE